MKSKTSARFEPATRRLLAFRSTDWAIKKVIKYQILYKKC